MIDVSRGFAVCGEPDAGAVEQMEICMRLPFVVGGALMGDHHLGYKVPIGAAIALEGGIMPSGVGFDIGCGNKAVLTDFPSDELRTNIKTIMDDLFKTLSFGIGRKNQDKVQTPMSDALWEDLRWDNPVPKKLRKLAESQLGTIGSGNHYVDLFTDELDRVWVGVHFGSRGFGHRIATHYFEKAGETDIMYGIPVVLSLDSDLGASYTEDMDLGLEYAKTGRDWVCSKVAGDVLGASITREIENHHNYAFVEEFDGEKLMVIRKGSTPNYEGKQSFVGGSMGDYSYILEGGGTEVSDLLYHSTVHGAGRVMGRRQATGKIKRAKLSRLLEGGDLSHLQDKLSDKQKDLLDHYIKNKDTDRPDRDIKIGVKTREGEISQDMMDEWINDFGVEVRGGGTDESPHCYKRINQVIESQGPTVKVVHKLKPVGVAMAAPETFDPFKD